MAELKRTLSTPLTEDEANSLTKAEKEWLRNWNRHGEIPGEDVPEGTDTTEDEAGDGDEADYDDLTIDELKDRLRDRDLPVSGSKQDLIDRLEEDDESED